jgi:hypothetical protein
VTDGGRTLPTYPVRTWGTVTKVYAEAVKGDGYRIEVTNRLNRRVGLVIAVDGRNIITGGKSNLGNNERMYILEPYGSGEFSGWRTGNDRVNRFYFTEVPDSYAAAFGDESAMGVIAVAAYPEVVRYVPPRHQISPLQPQGGFGRACDSCSAREKSSAGPAGAAPSAEARSGAESKMQADNEGAGTGFGHEEYSPVRTVEFEPERRAAAKILVKYEWRSTLCKIGVAYCGQPRPPRNRLWDSDGFAPYPPVRS